VIENLEYLKSSVQLKPQNSNADPIPANFASGSIQGTTFRVGFDSNALAPGVNYNLAIVPNTLFDIQQKGVFLANTHSYQTLSCGPNGNIVNGKCVCNDGYTGIDCSACTFGYLPSTRGICTNNFCQQGFCGCRYNGSTCTPLGKCFIDQSSQTTKCACANGYTGDNCERCATGYHGRHPECIVDVQCAKPCTLSRGECNLNTGICDCFDQFGGETCASCAPGFVGDNCDKSTGNSGTVTIVLVILAIILIIVTGFLVVRRQRLKKLQDPRNYAPVTLETIDDADKDDIDDKDYGDYKNEKDNAMEASGLFKPSAGDKFEGMASTVLESQDLSSKNKKDKEKKKNEDDENLLL